MEQDEVFARHLKERSREHSNAVWPQHRAIRAEGAVRHINVVVRDPQGARVGGLSGEVYWHGLEVNEF